MPDSLFEPALSLTLNRVFKIEDIAWHKDVLPAAPATPIIKGFCFLSCNLAQKRKYLNNIREKTRLNISLLCDFIVSKLFFRDKSHKVTDWVPFISHNSKLQAQICAMINFVIFDVKPRLPPLDHPKKFFDP